MELQGAIFTLKGFEELENAADIKNIDAVFGNFAASIVEKSNALKKWFGRLKGVYKQILVINTKDQHLTPDDAKAVYAQLKDYIILDLTGKETAFRNIEQGYNAISGESLGLAINAGNIVFINLPKLLRQQVPSRMEYLFDTILHETTHVMETRLKDFDETYLQTGADMHMTKMPVPGELAQYYESSRLYSDNNDDEQLEVLVEWLTYALLVQNAYEEGALTTLIQELENTLDKALI